MPIVNMNDMLHHAHHNGYAVGCFDLVSLDFLKGIMEAAERARAPVILSLSESIFKHSDSELLMPAIEAAATRASVPVAIHLDRCTGLQSAVRAINLGCNGVTVDASHLSIQESFDLSSEIVNMAHGCGVSVQGQLSSPAITDSTPEAIRDCVEKIGLDWLDVSREILHDSTARKPELNYHRLKQINETLGIPLVLQGQRELPDDQFQELIANGVAKINFSTTLWEFASKPSKKDIGRDSLYDYNCMVEKIVSMVANQTERYMHLLKSTNRAANVLAQCQPWAPVEHLIIYNVQGLDQDGIKSMITEGHRVLSTIPGVREVFTGKAVQEEASYRYTWLVRFCHPSVIDSYRVHPVHTAFADKLFRPVAAERISIDFQTIE